MKIKFHLSEKFINFGFFLITGISVLILNLYPVWYLKKNAPEGRTYNMVHNNVQDYHFYQALMNEGAGGSWLIYDPYTSESHQPSIIFSYFTWLGKISRVFNISYVYTYHLARILGSILFFIAAFKLLSVIKLPHKRLAWLFFLFTPPLFTLRAVGDKLDKIPYMYWWTGMDPVRRASYLPHHMIGAFLLIWSVILILRFFYSGKIKYIVFTSIVALPMAFVHTPSLLILLIILPPSIIIWLLLRLLTSGNINKKPVMFLAFALFWTLSLLFLAFMVSQTDKGFPWSQYREWERNLQYPLNKELIGALGILFPLAVIGIIYSLLSLRFDRIFIAVWFVLPFLLIPLSSKFSISNIRLIQGIPYLSEAILAILGIDFLILLLKKFYKKFIPFRLPLSLSGSIYVLLGLVFLVHAYPSLIWSIKDSIREFSPIFGNVYLDNRLFNAFDYINDNYPQKTLTLGTFYTGNYLPVYTHTVSFIGHSGYTDKLSEKESLVFKFFEHKMAPEEAKSFILDNRITLVFQGPEEKPIYSGYLYPDVLKPVYDRQEATLYVLK
ncbi:hypothetical protein A3D05_03175 [Candidatus Gottesmanbacteria bacterium RIFCSPHIGHO2_02_FULL_40_24]|uniref:Glycosyltransferase RgtA/B/C/D-like domain-containing protein n=1 Tax=Candidatus Gottesmanbacteria bacterium RIFCSPHIGHO2_01_FULL_40_15 TaxID=1798376 RepID=A0A1F5Z0B8_9BACT|nr:MAG: hypothetical protein A2777_04755 [Candidatus Gottesmanbacteria bacterium RIFCSPHIGHO2_01_FULL_40_15]OGG17694.1 MAG: hypothetical protein A3D05_03175 [Candidatus Gottesmanbacteria bacterium RIFCSPHIGHO2_02_FULL_40_24]OGG21609.1 MAG: hypothetical protein A3B48_04850 [Candidatus Gottesmanbacteria bacterium RIFCSPLOWO2_01_FULL_40_10]OGG24801.1 MAG: hypothetical protein A3E42_02405 [Candidatus Gottesmanbacteria bacterium RIFCSPHIGHO2_12_FULL_40_13]OGG33083.1 MAG: hypothetical protein A3I80_0